jgi:hypothetical protein
LLFISLSFISFLFHELLGKKREPNEMELEIVSGENSSKQSTKYPSTMKHMQQRLIHVEHSYLKLKEFSFVFACFFSTNKYISIELVQWNTLSNERPKQVQQKSKE